MPSDRHIHVVDDDFGVRRSLARLLEASGFIVNVYESGAMFLEASHSMVSACALIDVRMPIMDGLELHRALAERGIALPVIIMTGQGDIATAVRAMKGGAFDFIEKPFSDELLLATVEMALNAPGLDERHRMAREAASRVASLSRRELQVLDSILEGHPNKTIAVTLGLSVRTVEVHRARMMERLGVRQMAEAVRLAVLARMSL